LTTLSQQQRGKEDEEDILLVVAAAADDKSYKTKEICLTGVSSSTEFVVTYETTTLLLGLARRFTTYV